jgi:hypothetical protein
MPRERGRRRSAVFTRKTVLGPYRRGMELSPKNSRFFGGALLQLGEERRYLPRIKDNRQISWLSFLFTTGKYLRLFFMFTIKIYERG